MEIKGILNDIKQVSEQIDEARKEVEVKQRDLGLAKSGLNILENCLQTFLTSLDDKLRGGDQEAIIDKTEIEGCEIKTVQSRPAVIVEDANALPERFIINKPQVDKKAIKEALDNGEKVEGASMREVTQELRVEIK